ncbi:MAG: MoaD/ThiS family protein [Deltaproteobacteria bacterium]|nr:MAG: MoaD/ThiS family protein [Deltaproteobacteria bacterium]
MKIIVESMGLPTLSKLIGKKNEFDVNDATVTVEDLVSFIVKRHGQNARKVLLDSKGNLDMAIQVMINDEGFLAREDYARRKLGEEDRVRFMLLVGGG